MAWKIEFSIEGENDSDYDKIFEYVKNIKGIKAKPLPESPTQEEAPQAAKEQGEDWKAKVEFYRQETDRLRDYIFKNNIGAPCQSIFQAAIDEIEKLRQSQQEQEAIDEDAIGIVRELAEWSERYPRGKIYPMSQKKMDDELIAIEEKAKQFTITRKP